MKYLPLAFATGLFATPLAEAQVVTTYSQVQGPVLTVKRGNLCKLIEILDITTNKHVVVATLDSDDLVLAGVAKGFGMQVQLSSAAALTQPGSPPGMYCISCPTLHPVPGGPIMTDYAIINAIHLN